MNTTFWGPSGWEFLHTLTFIYPIKPSYNDKVKMQKFMTSIEYILPCKYCRTSFTKYIKTLPITNIGKKYGVSGKCIRKCISNYRKC